MFSTLTFRLLHDGTALKDAGLLVLRLWFGLVLALGHGRSKVADLASFAEGVAKRGIPLPEVSAFFAASSEFLGGILLALGLLTRLSAAAVFGTMLVAGLVVHWDDPFMKKEFALAYAVAAFCLLASGAGRYSLDELLRKRLELRTRSGE